MRLINYFLLFTLWFLPPFVVKSQVVNWGHPQKSNIKNFIPVTIGDDDDFIYSQHKVYEAIVINRFNKSTLKPSTPYIIDLEKIGKYREKFVKVIYLNSNVIVFKSYYARKEKRLSLYAHFYDLKKGALGKKIPICEYEIGGESSSHFYIYDSPDKSKILVNYYGYSYKFHEYTDAYMLFDNQLNKLIEREDLIPKKDTNYSESHYTLNNYGSFFFLRKLEDKNPSIVSLDVNKKYEKWEEQVDLGSLGMRPNSRITDLSFSLDAQQDLSIAGYYKEENSEFNGDGYFFMKLDHESKEVKLANLGLFSSEFKAEISEKREFDKNYMQPSSLSKIRIIHKKDGGIIMAGERYEKIVYGLDRSTGRFIYKEKFGDIILLGLSETGELLWSSTLPKLQYVSSSVSYDDVQVSGSIGSHFSFYIGILNDKICLAYNNHVDYKGTSPKPFPALDGINKSAANIAKVNMETGQLEGHKVVLSYGQSGLKLESLSTYLFEHGAGVALFASNKKNHKYGLVTFK